MEQKNQGYEKSIFDNILEFYNLNTFLKIKPISFDIGKLLFSFGEFDNNKKLIKQVDFYLDIKNSASGKNANVLCQDILSGRLLAEMDREEVKRLGKKLREMTEQEKQAIPKNKQYAEAVRMYQGGVPAQKAAREDKMALAKILKISRGSKKPVIITCESGPGIQTEQGLIVPRYENGRAETLIRVSLTKDDLKTIAIVVPQWYNAWLSAKMSVNMFAQKKQEKQSQTSSNTTTKTVQKYTARWLEEDGRFVCSKCRAPADYVYDKIESGLKQQNLSKFCYACGSEMH